MANVITGTSANFDSLLEGDKPVFVDFWATWCGPCRMVGPIVEQLADEYEGQVVFAKVDVDEEPDLARRYQIYSIPNMIIFKDGEIAEQIVGARPKAMLDEKIREAL